MNSASCEKNFLSLLKNLSPTRITESGQLKIGDTAWGIILDYTIESVKINCYKPDNPSTTAVLKISDEFGHTVCVIKGKSVGLLFGVNEEEWSEIESLCDYNQQLFYKYFKDGLSKNFGSGQRHFYNFCHVNKKQDVFLVIYERGVNMRKTDYSDTLLNIKHIQNNCNNHIINLYINHLRKNKM
ncbi:unnamed protein product [Pieris macdunnoughi]|uniref:Uncharacterized protein n=1 Tax=Pieris macdunnoughi TaxID=345717 RepID=A0A821MRZ8_9NEOP|nr:unnamed protein product [Pieris macdunnoughi]